LQVVFTQPLLVFGSWNDVVPNQQGAWQGERGVTAAVLDYTCLQACIIISSSAFTLIGMQPIKAHLMRRTVDMG